MNELTRLIYKCHPNLLLVGAVSNILIIRKQINKQIHEKHVSTGKQW